MSSHDHLHTIRLYMKAIEDGTFSPVADLFAPEGTVQQLPNRIYPQGSRGGLAQMAEAFEKGRKLLSSQTYEIKNAVVNGDVVAVEIFWTGTMAVPLGSLAAGDKMRAHSAMFFEFKDGKIARQRNYDCFEPW